MVACCCGSPLVTAVRAALVYDLAADWAVGSNPGGSWTYGAYGTGSGGTLDPSTFTPFPSHFANQFGGLDIWCFGGGVSDPNIEKNVTASDIVAFGIDWVPGKVAFGPKSGPTVARWTAPATGYYDIAATYMTIQTVNNPPNAEAHVYVGLTEVFDRTLTAVSEAQFGTPENYSASYVSIVAGQTVDFVVFANGSDQTKTTAVDATITLVPEPTLAGLLALGGLLLSGRRSPRR